MTEDRELQQIMNRTRANLQKKTKNINSLVNASSPRPILDNSVTKTNALARAWYRFPLAQKRVMESLVSKIDPRRDDSPPEQELLASTYAEAFNVTPQVAYRQLTKAMDSLMTTVIQVSTPDNNGKSKYRKFNLMDEAEYIESEGRIVCRFSPGIFHHLVNVSKDFTKYPLIDAVDFKSSYSWRLYEILVSWTDSKKNAGAIAGKIQRIEVDELRRMLGVPESYTWGMFNSQVLTCGFDEIQELRGIKTSITRHKTGRKITHLTIKYQEVS